jgi:hypothetical protein
MMRARCEFSRACIFVAVLFTHVVSQAATLYRCPGTNGTIVWQERPCTQGRAVTVAPQPPIDATAPAPSPRTAPSAKEKSRNKTALAPPLDPATRLRLAQIDEAIARLMTERRTLKTQLEADLAALRATPATRRSPCLQSRAKSPGGTDPGTRTTLPCRATRAGNTHQRVTE